MRYVLVLFWFDLHIYICRNFSFNAFTIYINIFDLFDFFKTDYTIMDDLNHDKKILVEMIFHYKEYTI